MPHSPPRRARTTTAENPFASFYESRRKISLETDDDETADPSSSITRAYIVPDALLALARGERDGSVKGILVDAPPAGHAGTSLIRFVETDRAEVSTDSPKSVSPNPFRFRSPPMVGLAAEWRSVQRIALQMASWLRRAWRRTIPN